jgi:hypothetical protein
MTSSGGDFYWFNFSDSWNSNWTAKDYDKWMMNETIATFSLYNASWDNRGLIASVNTTANINHTANTFTWMNDSWDNRGLIASVNNSLSGYAKMNFLNVGDFLINSMNIFNFSHREISGENFSILTTNNSGALGVGGLFLNDENGNQFKLGFLNYGGILIYSNDFLKYSEFYLDPTENATIISSSTDIRILPDVDGENENARNVSVQGDVHIYGNITSSGGVTLKGGNFFKGLFNFTFSNGWFSFDGNTAIFNETKLNNSIDGRFYDVTICSSGCDYTSIATAVSTEKINKSFFVKKGIYTETQSVTILNGQSFYFEDLVDLRFGNKFADLNITGIDVQLKGKLKITGEASGSALLWVTTPSKRLDTSNCFIWMNPNSTSPTSWYTVVYLQGTDSLFGTIYGKDISFSSDNSGNQHNFLLDVSNRSSGNLILDSFKDSGGTGSSFVAGFQSQGTQNTWRVIVNDVTTTTGNTGRGVFISSSSVRAQISGTTANCDGNNYLDGGSTTENVAALATT